MQKQHGLRPLFRKVIHYLPIQRLVQCKSWSWMRLYPAVIPDETCFNDWQTVQEGNEWESYRQWLKSYGCLSLNAWYQLRASVKTWEHPPKISLVTPVHNTSVAVLYECLMSVRTQAYPYWQWILVDDGSTDKNTLQLLNSEPFQDPRIKRLFLTHSQGISGATNKALEQVQGDYVVFLDHDDRLALDALFYIAQAIREQANVDILYSDRDMISPEGKRYQHLFKPDWSPETLLSGNYIFHLMCYRNSLLKQLGGLRSEFDGSQDYDLILRAAETKPLVQHIPKILYHWRQHSGSVSLDSGAKDYAFQAGIQALNQTLQRRGIAGYAQEISTLWRGNYQLTLDLPKLSEIERIQIPENLPKTDYTAFVNQQVQGTKTYIALISQQLSSTSVKTIQELAAYLTLDEVGLASGRIINQKGLIRYIGASYQPQGELLLPYQGYPITEMSYMAVTQLMRNISAPHPYCVVMRSELWQQLAGLNPDFKGFYSLLDFALKAQQQKWRCVSVPQVSFTLMGEDLLQDNQADRRLFLKYWAHYLEQGDPYYNKNFDTMVTAPYHLKH